MIMFVVDNEVKRVSDEISSKSVNEAEYFPVDKKFLKKYLHQILELDPVEFVFYNFEKVNPTYTNILFLCLPEVWRKLDLSSLIFMMKNFTNTFSYYTLMQFTYKYLEIDILPLVISSAQNRGSRFHHDIKDYLLKQWNVLIKTEEERNELERGYEKDFLNYDVEEWTYIRQKFLLDPRVGITIQNKEILRNYINTLLR